MSMSTAADMWAGSRSPTSSTIGKVRVWSEARFWVVPPPPPPQATRTRLATPPTDRALRIRNEVGVIAFPYQSLRPSLFPPPSSRCLRGTTGARARRRGVADVRPTYSTPHCGWAGRECLPALPSPVPRSWHHRPVAVGGLGLRRKEGRGKVDGSTRFTADLDLPGLLHVQLVLSHLPSARIRGVETGAARSAPGVLAVVTGADLPDVQAAGPDKPLAVDRVFYAGQPVAAVIAESESAAADAAALVEVDFELLPFVADAERAMRDEAPIVLEAGADGSEGDASMHGAATESESEPVQRPRNVSSVANFKRGDVAAGLAASDAVIRATYRIAGVHHSFIEPHVSMVRPEPDGGVTIWAPTQGPFAVRDEIAKVLDAAPHEVRVISMPVGGGFGGKVTLLETLLALLARKLRRPLRLTLSRQQEFLMGHPAPGARIDLELGAKRDGTLVALRARYHYDNGATGGWHAGITGSFLAGTYRVPNFEVTGYEVSTNKTPTDAYRAPGGPQAYFALESAMDELASELGIDPIELRLRNASREGDINADGSNWPRIAMIECLEAARRHPLYAAPVGPGEGVGVALGAWGGARSPAAAGCRVEPDGTVSILIGSPDISGSS